MKIWSLFSEKHRTKDFVNIEAKKLELKVTLSETLVQRCSVKKGVLRNFTKFTGKQLYQSLSFNKVAGLRRRLGIFIVNF